MYKWDIISSYWLSTLSSDETYVYNSIRNCSPNMKAYLKEDIPDRYHYRYNNRIQPIILVADEGWTIVQNESLSKCKCIFLLHSISWLTREIDLFTCRKIMEYVAVLSRFTACFCHNCNSYCCIGGCQKQVLLNPLQDVLFRDVISQRLFDLW